MIERKPSPFPILLNNDVCSLIQAAENVYQIRFKNRAANAYLVRGKSRTIMIDTPRERASDPTKLMRRCSDRLARSDG